MKKRVPLWLLGAAVWLGAFGVATGLMFYRSSRAGYPSRIDWPAVGLLATALTILALQVIGRVRAQPTPEQRAALSAIFAAGPGTISAVVVTRNGVPEVLATVRSTEEYMELAGSGQLPQDHRVYLPDDLI